MSIIYEALKKSQEKRAAAQPKPAKAVAKPVSSNLRRNMVITLLFLTCLFTIIMAATMPKAEMPKLILGKNDTAKPIKPYALDSKSVIIPKMILNGVFLSDKETLAVINDKSYHLGDKVQGFEVASITLDQVTLQNKKRTITLRNALAQ